MSARINFMALSKDKDQLVRLKGYIESLYKRNWSYISTVHSMDGCPISLHTIGDYTVMTGQHQGCDVADLSYWCNVEGKNYFIENLVYIEDRDWDDTLYMYYYTDADSSEGILCKSFPLLNVNSGELLSPMPDFPEELLNVIVEFFSTGDIKNKEG